MSEYNNNCDHCNENCTGNCETCQETECNHDCANCSENTGGCNHDCANCSEDCSGRIEKAVPTTDTKIGKVIAVLSGKGGVGKSMVTSLLAVELAKKGYKVGLLDGDITGPSIPKMFDLKGQLFGDEEGIVPAESKLGIKVISINMMLEHEDDPVLWRGIILGNTLKQFYSEVHWGDLDYLLIDMPPGTGDVPISLFQSVPVDSLVMVTTPSKLVSMVVGKAINMAKQVNKPIVALVENMSFVKCPDCGKEITIYNNDDTKATGEKYGLDVLAKLPIDPIIANFADDGEIENYNEHYLSSLIEKL